MTEPAPIRPQDIELPPTQPLDISHVIDLAQQEMPTPTTSGFSDPFPASEQHRHGTAA